MPEMIVLDHTGHRSFDWSVTDPAGVTAAAAEFAALRAEGRIPFAAEPGATEPYQLRSFDPDLACDIVWLRPIAGG